MVAKAPVDIDAVDILPILPSLNFSQTADFYVNHLGFHEVDGPCDDYRIFRRGRMELCFWYCVDPMMAANSSVFIRTANAHDLFEEYVARGVEGVRATDADEVCAEKFHVRDPHGNLLMFLTPQAQPA